MVPEGLQWPLNQLALESGSGKDILKLGQGISRKREVLWNST